MAATNKAKRDAFVSGLPADDRRPPMMAPVPKRDDGAAGLMGAGGAAGAGDRRS